MDHFEARRTRLFDELSDDVTAVVLTPGSPLTYFAGIPMSPLEEHGSERIFMLLLARDQDPAFIVPEAELNRIRESALSDANAYTYDHAGAEDPRAIVQRAFESLAEEYDLTGQVALEHRYVRLLEYDLLAGRWPWGEVVDLGPAFNRLRARKDERELELLRTAGRITDRCLADAFEALEAGMTESEVERALERTILESDADGLGVTLVLSGDRTANVMANTSTREIETGDPVLIDTGVVYEGYYTDVTRTVALGSPGEEFREIYEIVRTANREARNSVEEGIECRQIDLAAREIIEEHGYSIKGRIGHGLGLDGHEPPYIGPSNRTRLETGNVFTIEPGIYRDSVGGVRIEDNVAITEDGPETFSNHPRELKIY